MAIDKGLEEQIALMCEGWANQISQMPIFSAGPRVSNGDPSVLRSELEKIMNYMSTLGKIYSDLVKLSNVIKKKFNAAEELYERELARVVSSLTPEEKKATSADERTRIAEAKCFGFRDEMLFYKGLKELLDEYRELVERRMRELRFYHGGILGEIGAMKIERGLHGSMGAAERGHFDEADEALRASIQDQGGPGHRLFQ